MSDLVRLEVERPVDSGELVNLVQNPSGDTGAWAYLTPVEGSALRSVVVAGERRLSYTSPGGGVASYFTTEPLPVVPGRPWSASWRPPRVDGRYRARVQWVAADGTVTDGPTTGYLIGGGGGVPLGPVTVPAGTMTALLRWDHYANTSAAAPAAGAVLQVRDVAVVSPVDDTPLAPRVRTNLVTAPTGQHGARGWTASGDAVINTAGQGYAGDRCISITQGGAPGPMVAHAPTHDVTPHRDYALQVRLRPAQRPRTGILVAEWTSTTGAVTVQRLGRLVEVPGEWSAPLTDVVTAGGRAASLRLAVRYGGCSEYETHYLDAVMVEQASTVGGYFDGDTPDVSGGTTYAWTGEPGRSTSTATAPAGDLGVLSPTPFVNVMGPTHQIDTDRTGLDVGTLEATIYDSTLHPARADTIRPGRRVRLTSPDGTEVIYTGRALDAAVTYRATERDEDKRTQIKITATDAVATLANTERPEGVGSIADLPYVLEGCGVPWNVNGSGDQVPAAEVVAYNESASAVDQVTVTRDSAYGLAWVDRNGVVQAWDRNLLPGGPDAVRWVLDEDVYGPDVDIDYATAGIINTLTISVLTIDPTSGATSEEPYGPYIDADSVREYGVRTPSGGPISVQGTQWDETTVAAYADQVLAANAFPQLRVNTVTIPMDGYRDLALLDLYDLAQVINGPAELDNLARVASVKHTITADRDRPNGKWTMTVTFVGEQTAAAGRAVPSPPSPLGQVAAALVERITEKVIYQPFAPTNEANQPDDVWRHEVDGVVVAEYVGQGGTTWTRTPSATVATALSGQRVEVSTDGLRAYNAADQVVTAVMASNGNLTSSRSLFAATTPATTAPGNTPALRVGAPAGRHQRLDGNDIVAMNSDGEQGELFLNSGGLTRTTDLNVMGRVRSPLLLNNALVGEEAVTFRCVDSAGNTRGEAQFSRGTNYKWKIRNTGQPSAGGVALTALDTRIGVTRAGMDAADFTEANTQSFVANQITAFQGLFDNSANGGGSDPAYFNSGGRLVRGGGSSRRVKYVDADLDLATARRVLALQPVLYRYRSEVKEMGEDAVTYPGFVAEDADAAGLDLWVSYDDEGRPARIRYAELTAALVALASNTEDRLTAAEKRIARLEQTMARLDPDQTGA